MTKNTIGSFNPLASQADIPLSRDSSTRLLPWIIGFMTYITSLAMIGVIVLSALIETWEISLNSALTIQIPAEGRQNMPLEKRADAVRALLEKNPNVQGFEWLDRKAVSLLLEPWLGMTSLPQDLPVPELITVFIPQINDIDIQRLALQLKAIDPLISVDTHEVWRNQLLRVMQSLQLIAGLVVSVLLVAAVTVVIFATRGGLATHRDIVELLHLIGAHNAYIAKQFQTHVLKTCLKGCIGGMLLTLATVGLVFYLAQGLGESLMPAKLLSAPQWGLLLLVPPVIIAISVVTTRQTVMVNLRKMM